MRLLTLERLLHIDAVELNVALSQAATILAEILATDKIDIFLYEPSTTTLVSYGVSDTPMGQQQKALGLDRLPLANKGRVVEVFETGEPFCSAHLDEDPHELIGVKERLGIRSMMNVSLVVNGECRGVFSAVSAQPEAFSDGDFQFFQTVSRWVALVVHRAELTERLAQRSVQRGRQQVAEELSRLTRREQEVASLIAEGLTNVEIADRLSITPGTAANHSEHIREKLSLRSRAQVAVWAVEHGLYRSDQESPAVSGG